MDITFLYTMDVQHFRSASAISAVCVCMYCIYDKWWTVFNMILVLWPNHSNKPLKTCWKCLLNRPAVLYGNYLNTTSNKIYKWSFVYELQILVYNHVRLVKLGFLSHECDWLWTTGWPGFHPSIIYFCCHFCLPFSLSSTSKVPSSPFFPSSFLL